MAKYLVTATALTVREGPDKSFKAISYMKEMDIVEVLGGNEDESWKKVQTISGLIGWCSSQYLSPVSSSPVDTASASGSYTVNPLVLFIRQGPSRSYRVVGLAKMGDVVDAIDRSLDGAWVKIRNGKSITGWCLDKYLTLDTKSASTQIGMHRLAKYSINIYEKPGQVVSLIGQATADYLVNVSEVSPDTTWKKITTHLGITGWCLAEFLNSLGDIGRILPHEEFPWMPIAFGEMGVREYPGSKHNVRIQEYLDSTSLGDGPTLPDETHWCAAFVNWCVEEAGIASNNSPVVSAWVKWGEALSVPRRGCIVTFKWDDGGSHVAFYLGESGDKVYALGGNQSDGVWIMAYLKKNVTAYRIPIKWKL